MSDDGVLLPFTLAMQILEHLYAKSHSLSGTIQTLGGVIHSLTEWCAVVDSLLQSLTILLPYHSEGSFSQAPTPWFYLSMKARRSDYRWLVILVGCYAILLLDVWTLCLLAFGVLCWSVLDLFTLLIGSVLCLDYSFWSIAWFSALLFVAWVASLFLSFLLWMVWIWLLFLWAIMHLVWAYLL